MDFNVWRHFVLSFLSTKSSNWGRSLSLSRPESLGKVICVYREDALPFLCTGDDFFLIVLETFWVGRRPNLASSLAYCFLMALAGFNHAFYHPPTHTRETKISSRASQTVRAWKTKHTKKKYCKFHENFKKY